MKQDKFLTGILIGIGVLVVGAVAMFFVRQSTLDYKTENTPEAVVHNYILAIEREDYKKAYSYLKEGDHKPTITEFRQVCNNRCRDDSGTQILETDYYEDDSGTEMATVSLDTTNYNSGPLIRSGYSYINNASLIKQAGEWKIEEMPYQYWDWNWYQDLD